MPFNLPIRLENIDIFTRNIDYSIINNNNNHIKCIFWLSANNVSHSRHSAPDLEKKEMKKKMYPFRFELKDCRKILIFNFFGSDFSE